MFTKLAEPWGAGRFARTREAGPQRDATLDHRGGYPRPSEEGAPGRSPRSRAVAQGQEESLRFHRDIRLNCAEMKLKPIGDLDEYVQDLSDRRLIEVEAFREIGIRGAPTENLETYLDTLFKRVEAGISER